MQHAKHYPEYKGATFGTRMADWQERIDVHRMRKDRYERLIEMFKKHGVEVMLALVPHHQRYATGFYHWSYTTGLAYVLIPREGEPVIFGHGTLYIQDRRHVRWIKSENIRWSIPSIIGGMSAGLILDPAALNYQKKKIAGQLKDTLGELKLGRETLTIDTHDSNVLSACHMVGIKTEVKPEVFEEAEEIKTKDEIECTKIAYSIGEACFQTLVENSRPGMHELQLAGLMTAKAMELGAEATPQCFVCSGPNTWPNYRSMTDRMFRPGDVFFSDVPFISFLGYRTCYYRTFSMGKPSKAAIDTHERVKGWLLDALKTVKPGSTTKDLVEKWPDEREYWGEEPDACWGDNVLHGIGLHHYGPPQAFRDLSIEHPYPFKKGHVFAIECQDGIGDGQGVRIEEGVVVTDNGCERIGKWPLEIINTWKV